MDGFGRGAASGRFACRECRIEHRHVPERNVGGGHVEIVLERFFDALESLRPHFLVGIEVREDFTRKEVFFKGHHVRIGIAACERLDECPVPCRGFQQAARAHMIVVQHVGECLRNCRRSVERRQHRTFQAVDIAFVFAVVRAVLADQAVQLRRHRE